MSAIPRYSQEQIRALASKYIWWKTPEEASALPERVIAQVMNIGDYDDVQMLVKLVGDEVLREVLVSSEAGQFNARSWSYWHYRLGLAKVDEVPPLPVRRFEAAASAELIQAFAETRYDVHHEAPFTMHIGRPCPELKALMAEHNALSAAFITAWNPFSQNLPSKENEDRQDELKTSLKKRGLIYIDGIGKHPSNNWPGEASVLVLGLDLEAAKSLARHYEQHAFVWAASDGVPELITGWTRRATMHSWDNFRDFGSNT